MLVPWLNVPSSLYHTPRICEYLLRGPATCWNLWANWSSLPGMTVCFCNSYTPVDSENVALVVRFGYGLLWHEMDYVCEDYPDWRLCRLPKQTTVPDVRFWSCRCSTKSVIMVRKSDTTLGTMLRSAFNVMQEQNVSRSLYKMKDVFEFQNLVIEDQKGNRW